MLGMAEPRDFCIPVTQFIMPHGTPRPMYAWVTKSAHDKASQIIKAGYKFEAEVLTTGEVSLTVADPVAGKDVAIEVCGNGPELVDAMDRMIDRVYVTLHRTF